MVVGIANYTETKEEIRYEEIPCEKQTRQNPAMDKGEEKIVQKCVNGKTKIVDKVTYKHGKELNREESRRTTETQQIPEVTEVGTKEPEPEPTVTKDNAVAPATQPTTSQSTSSTPSQNIDYSNQIQDGYCKDGTAVRGNPHARGASNACYGRGGWVGN